MKDFLGNLAAQTLRLLPVVRPRPVSIFEPIRSIEPLGAEEDSGGAPFYPKAPILQNELPRAKPEPETSRSRLEEKYRHFPKPAVSAPSPSQPAGLIPDIGGAWEERLDSGNNSGQSGLRAQTQEQSFGESLNRTGVGPDSEGTKHGPEQPGLLRGAKKPIPQMQQADTSDFAFEPVFDERSLPSPVSPNRDMPSQIRAGENRRTISIKPATEQIAKGPVPDGHYEKSFQDITPRRRRSTFGANKEKPPEPTIQVTIGRIEIKAVPPVASPPKRETKRKTMSLDDYLKQRNEGGRR